MNQDIYRGMSSIFDSKAVEELYNSWVSYNRNIYQKYFIIIAISLSALLIPFDFLLFTDPTHYTKGRALYIILLAILLIFIKPLNDTHQSFMYTPSIVLVMPGLVVNFLYIYFLFTSQDESYIIVLLANFLIIIISTLFMYRFWKEQYIINIMSIITLLTIGIISNSHLNDIVRLVSFHIISFIIVIYFRFQFIDSLSKRYNYISSLVPTRIARYITIAEGSIDAEDIFPAQERHTVCLCCDWRNFQKLSKVTNNKDMEIIIEKFYDIVFSELESIIPEGDYFADWTADELFIIFYNENEDKDKTIHDALLFAHSLSTKIFIEISSAIETRIAYDIGLASGKGILGLQGPHKFKKTTITGENAGISKRLETEAKGIREVLHHHFPTIAMDSYIYEKAKDIKLYQSNIFNKFSPLSKDINKACFSWTFMQKK